MDIRPSWLEQEGGSGEFSVGREAQYATACAHDRIVRRPRVLHKSRSTQRVLVTIVRVNYRAVLSGSINVQSGCCEANFLF